MSNLYHKTAKMWICDDNCNDEYHIQTPGGRANIMVEVSQDKVNRGKDTTKIQEFTIFLETIVQVLDAGLRNDSISTYRRTD